MSISPDYGRTFLRARRQELGLSTTELARTCGISRSHLSNLEAGRRRPTPALARTIAYHLDAPLDTLANPSAWGVAA